MKKIFLAFVPLILFFSGCTSSSINHIEKSSDILVNKRLLSNGLFHKDIDSTYVKFSPDGKYLVSSCIGHTSCSSVIEIWDVESETVVKRISAWGHKLNNSYSMQKFLFSNDNKILFIRNMKNMSIRNNRIRSVYDNLYGFSAYDLEKDRIKQVSTNYKMSRYDESFIKRAKGTEYPLATVLPLYTFKLTPDGNYIVTDGWRGSEGGIHRGYIFFNADTFEPVKYIKDIKRAPDLLTFSSDGKYFADVYMKKVKTDGTFEGYCKFPRNVEYCKYTKLHRPEYYIKQTDWSSYSQRNIRIYNTDTLELIQEIEDVGKTYALTFSNDNKYLISSYSQGTIYIEYMKESIMLSDKIEIYNIKSGEKIDEIIQHGAGGNVFESNKSGNARFLRLIDNRYLIVFNSGESTLKVFDYQTKQTLQEERLDGLILDDRVDITSDNKTLVIADDDGVWLYDIKIRNILKGEN